MATAEQFIDDLVNLVGGYVDPITFRFHGTPLLHALTRVANEPTVYGLTVIVPTAVPKLADILLVSPQALSNLGYATQQDYAQAYVGNMTPFIHPNDAQVVADHHDNNVSASYTARHLHDDGSYVRMLIQEFTFDFSNVDVIELIRVAVERIAP